MALENLFGLVKERWKKPEHTDNKQSSDKTAAATAITADTANAAEPAAREPMFKCPRCMQTTPGEAFEKNLKVCPVCNFHGRMSAVERLRIFADKNTFTELDSRLTSSNPIGFPGYDEKMKALQEKTGLKDAIITGRASIHGIPFVLGIMDSNFLMASMGSVVGERIVRAFEYAADQHLPVIMFTASGGARMQEGLISLMQMAKTSAAAARFAESGGLYITVLTDPTTGGVEASFASLGDIIIAEPKVLIGFAGRRVIEGTIKQRLPEDFQSAEFQLEHGFCDMIVERRNLRKTIRHILRLHGYKCGTNTGVNADAGTGAGTSASSDSNASIKSSVSSDSNASINSSVSSDSNASSDVCKSASSDVRTSASSDVHKSASSDVRTSGNSNGNGGDLHA